MASFFYGNRFKDIWDPNQDYQNPKFSTGTWEVSDEDAVDKANSKLFTKCQNEGKPFFSLNI